MRWRCTHCGHWNYAKTRVCGGLAHGVGCKRPAPSRRVTAAMLRERQAEHRIAAILKKHGL